MFLKYLRGLISGGPYYLRLNRERVSVRNVSNGNTVEIPAKIGLSDSNTLLSIGEPVDPTAARILVPFQHPRILIEDFTGGETIVKHAFRELSGKLAFAPAPIVVVHPDIELDGGLTQIEARALREMVEGAGARQVYLHYGRQLTDQEVASLSFEDFDSAEQRLSADRSRKGGLS